MASAAVSNVLVVSYCCCCWCPWWILLSSLLYCYLLSYSLILAVLLLLLQGIPFCFRPYCVGHPVVAFIPAVASFSAALGSHAIAVILAVAYCWRHCCFLLSCWYWHSCYCWRPLCSWCYHCCWPSCWCWHSCCCWRPLSSWCYPCCWPSCCCGVPGVVGIPASAFVPAVAGVLAVANISADPGVPILAAWCLSILGCTMCEYCSMRHIRLSDFRTMRLHLSDCYYSLLLEYRPGEF